MVGAGGIDEQQFGQRAPAVGVALDDQRTDRFGPRSAARLARRHDLEPLGAKCGDEQCSLSRLARPLPAFERDELARHFPMTRWRNALPTRPNGPAMATASLATSGRRAVGSPGVVTTSSAIFWPLAIGALIGPS